MQFKSYDADIVYGNGIGIISFDDATKVITQDNFETYKPINLDQIEFAFAGEYFVGWINQLSTSTDGIHWNTFNNGFSSLNWLFSYNEQVAVVAGKGSIYTSIDGISWKEHGSYPNLQSISYYPGVQQYVGTTGDEVVLTTDLINFQPLSISDQYMGQSIAFGNGVWVFTISEMITTEDFQGYIIASSDEQGSSWKTTFNESTTTYDATFSNAVFANSNFYVVDFYQNLFASPNGVNWGNVSVPGTVSNIFGANNQLYLQCNGAYFAYFLLQSDGQWQPIESLSYIVLNNLIYLPNGLYIALANAEILASADGINFQKAVAPSSVLFETAVSWIIEANGLYLAGDVLNLWIGK